MRTLTLHEAAELLDVHASTVLAWQQLFGFPAPHPLEGGRTGYAHDEVVSLHKALGEALSVVSAIEHATAVPGSGAFSAKTADGNRAA